jgi:orotate phosphoribosyltransferase
MIYHGNHGSLVDLETNVRRVTHGLRKHTRDFDFIAVSGMSGVVVGAPAALRLHKPLVIVRKDDDSNGHHAGGSFIGFDSVKGRYVIVDDFTSSGRTLEYIINRIDHQCLWSEYLRAPEYIGFFSYADNAWYPESGNVPIEE